MTQIAFTKYEGAGNDFILIDNREGIFTPDPSIIARLCDRHFGIGADGLMTLSTCDTANCTMHYYNADGSEGEMCGNGARCFTLFAYHLGVCSNICHFEATDGAHTAHLLQTDTHSGQIELGMINVSGICAGDGWWFLNTGVPHYVEFVEDVATVDLLTRGAAIRYDTTRFPQGTNVNFVQLLSSGAIRMRTYERGVENETLACGTGATAAALITNYAHQHSTDTFRVEVSGGELAVKFTHPQESQIYTDIRLTGPARRVFSGEIDLDNL